ncbi:MAG: usg protein [Rhodothalassiaceae bacterium]
MASRVPQPKASAEPMEKMMDGYRLATAEILYHMPDHPGLLQSYIWQDLDLAPRFPVLRRFLHFWETNLDGKVHSVRLGHSALIGAGEMRALDGQLHLH